MPNSKFPFAVRLIGFSSEEASLFEAVFAIGRGSRAGYVCLALDDLKDPDIYLANADELKALVTLSDLHPGDVRPALLVGSPQIELPYPCLKRPIRWPVFFDALKKLVEKRADTLCRLGVSEVVAVPERRRAPRVDLDLTDPATYAAMRASLPDDAGVVIVDKSPAIQSHIGDQLMRHKVSATWARDEAKAEELCRHLDVAAVLINTSTPGIDPYCLCRAIKQTSHARKTAVIFLVGKSFVYDPAHAREVGVDGILNKPLSRKQLLAALKKFLPALSR